MNTAVMKEIARLEKMIDRKKTEIEEHEEMLKMWKEKLNPQKEEGGKK